MPKILQLDPHVADLIAAGEVVERPASVVKELVENSIDAGASAVTVEIAHGGMSMIRITDNGCGIQLEDLATAFLRHATSKIRSQRDLEAIGTLGFRGEALAAISAVSRIDVMTRTAEAPVGASMSLEGGVPGPVEEAGCPPGTTMVVRDLFYNTPARLKFMKKDAAEGAAVFGVVQRQALSHPEVSLKFIRDGKQELLTPGDGQLKSALYAVLGRDIALGMIPVSGSGEEVSAAGFISLPTCCRGSRSTQFFFVNGRHVKSAMLTAAVEQAYANQKMVGKFPGCVIHVTTRLNAVDVNVHPTKTEVKFGSDRRVFDAVYYAVRSALEGDRTRSTLKLHADGSIGATPDSGVTIRPDGGRKTPVAAHRETAIPVQTSFSQEGAAPRKPSATGRIALADALRPRIPTEQPERLGASLRSEAARAGEEGRLAQGIGEHRPGPVKAVFSHCTGPTVEKQPESPQLSPTAAPAPASHSLPEVPQIPWRVAGEVLNTYIIVEQGDTILLIDKHAAHERMNFDRMKAADYQPMVQTLLTPITFTPGAEEGAVLLSHLSLLSDFGFEVEDFGGGALIVRQAPFDVDFADIESTLTELAAKLLVTGTADPAASRDDMLHTMACTAAIKGGQKNGLAELETVARAVISGQVKYCPHGRPVAIELTRAQLERQFKRA